MPDLPRKFILIAFKFPPFAGVAATRWTKLSTHLAARGFEIDAITVEWHNQGNSLESDLQQSTVRIHRIPSGVAHNTRIRTFASRLMRGLHWRLWKLIDRWLYWDDEAQRWARHLAPALRSIIKKHDHHTVVVTGGPFQAMRATAEALGPPLEGIRMIADFRDPWFAHGPPAKKAQIERWRSAVLARADHIVSVTHGLDAMIEQWDAQARSTRRSIVPNGFDPRTVQQIATQSATTDTQARYRFIYVGALFNGRDEPLQAFLEFLARQHARGTVHKTLIVGRFGATPFDPVRHLIEDATIELKGPVSQPEAFALIRQSEIALQLNARQFPYLVSTKIYEYGALGVPVWSLHYGGEIADLVSQNHLGRQWNLDQIAPQQLYAQMEEALEQRLDGSDGYDPRVATAAMERYSYESIADQYQRILD